MKPLDPAGTTRPFPKSSSRTASKGYCALFSAVGAWRRASVAEDAVCDALSVRLPISPRHSRRRGAECGRPLLLSPNQGASRVTAPQVIELPEILDMPAAAQLAETFAKRLGEPLALDASRVTRLGASCLQVLLAAARTWKAEGDALSLQNPSARFVEDLNLLGLEPATFLNGVIAP
jgi:chemotaxis protein CheX